MAHLLNNQKSVVRTNGGIALSRKQPERDFLGPFFLNTRMPNQNMPETGTGCNGKENRKRSLGNIEKSPRVDLDLNLPPPASPEPKVSSIECLNRNAAGSPSLTVLGCPLCYMFVMVSNVDPKCPKCQNALVDVLGATPTKKARI